MLPACALSEVPPDKATFNLLVDTTDSSASWSPLGSTPGLNFKTEGGHARLTCSFGFREGGEGRNRVRTPPPALGDGERDNLMLGVRRDRGESDSS